MTSYHAIAYVSRSTLNYQLDYSELAQEVEEIRRAAALNNLQMGLGGVLCYYRGVFFQYLEGDAQHIEHLKRKIPRDSRHEHFKLLLDNPIAKLQFDSWGMKYVTLDTQLLRFMTQNELEQDLYQIDTKLSKQFIKTVHDTQSYSDKVILEHEYQGTAIKGSVLNLYLNVLIASLIAALLIGIIYLI